MKHAISFFRVKSWPMAGKRRCLTRWANRTEVVAFLWHRSSNSQLHTGCNASGKITKLSMLGGHVRFKPQEPVPGEAFVLQHTVYARNAKQEAKRKV